MGITLRARFWFLFDVLYSRHNIFLKLRIYRLIAEYQDKRWLLAVLKPKSFAIQKVYYPWPKN